jgi:hypothetical protein
MMTETIIDIRGLPRQVSINNPRQIVIYTRDGKPVLIMYYLFSQLIGYTVNGVTRHSNRQRGLAADSLRRDYPGYIGSQLELSEAINSAVLTSLDLFKLNQ